MCLVDDPADQRGHELPGCRVGDGHVHDTEDLPGERVDDRAGGTGDVGEGVGVVLDPADQDVAPGARRHADGVGADDRLVAEEARCGPDRVHLQCGVRGAGPPLDDVDPTVGQEQRAAQVGQVRADRGHGWGGRPVQPAVVVDVGVVRSVDLVRPKTRSRGAAPRHTYDLADRIVVEVAVLDPGLHVAERQLAFVIELVRARCTLHRVESRSPASPQASDRHMKSR